MTQNQHCGPADRRLEPLTADGSVLGLQKAGVRVQHQDPRAIESSQLKIETEVIVWSQFVAFVCWELHLQGQDHVL